jgi:uncharacterized membrane protein YheB (UPF0754 family)
MLSKLTQSASHDNELRLKKIVHDQVARLSNTLSKDLMKEYAENINKYNSSLSDVLKNGF